MIRIFFRDAPYIGPRVANALDAAKDKVSMALRPEGVEIIAGDRWYIVPWSNLKSVELA